MKRIVLIVVAMAFAAMGAFAVDGVVLINQSTVMAAGGFPYVISQPGSYKLSGNLVATTGKMGVLVAASNATLDLNGFSVSCSFQQDIPFFSCIGDTNVQGAISNVTIRNGLVVLSATVDSTSGTIVNFDSTTNANIEDMQVKMNSPAVRGFVGMALGSGSIARHNIVSPNGNFIGGLNAQCSSIIVENVTGGIGTFGNGCVVINNVGFVNPF